MTPERKAHVTQYLREWHIRNRERRLAAQAIRRAANRQKLRESGREYHRKNREAINARKKAYKLAHLEEHRARTKRYKTANRDEILRKQKAYNARTVERRRIYKRNRINNDPVLRLSIALSARIRSGIKRSGTIKSKKTIDLIGCEISFLRHYLEARFQHGMTWENYGIKKGQWSIDHRIPCAAFDLSSEAEQKQCFHYSNLQPLWHVDNRIKSNKMPQKHQAELI